MRASTGGFLNWICDANTNFSKGLDNSTGLNFDSELTTAISTIFGFPRLTDESAAPAIGTPADNLAGAEQHLRCEPGGEHHLGSNQSRSRRAATSPSTS